MCAKWLGSLFFLVFIYSKAGAQQDWVLKKDKDGIQVYEAKNDNTSFKSVKAECTMTATLSRVAAVLSDIDHHNEWVYGVKAARIVQRVNEAQFFYYSEVSAPWPVSNRDFIIDFSMTQPAPAILSITSHAVPDMLPEQPGLVRIRNSMSQWTITSTGDNNVKVVYMIQFDPAGSVPSWIVNMFIADGPYKTFKNLRERVKMPAYKDAHFDFIKD